MFQLSSFSRKLRINQSRYPKQIVRIKILQTNSTYQVKINCDTRRRKDKCVSRYLDICFVRCYRRHNIISGVKILQFASEWSDKEAQGASGTRWKTGIEKDTYFISRWVEALCRDEGEERKIDKLPNSSVWLSYHGAHCHEPPDVNHIGVLSTS